MQGWGEKERAVFEEAMRVIPGMLACKDRRDHVGSRVLARGLLEFGCEREVMPCIVWSIMFSAALHWMQQMTMAVANHREISMEEMVQELVSAAADWQPDGV